MITEIKPNHTLKSLRGRLILFKLRVYLKKPQRLYLKKSPNTSGLLTVGSRNIADFPFLMSSEAFIGAGY